MSHRLIVIIFLAGAAIFVLSGCAASDTGEKTEMVEENAMDKQVEEPVVEEVEEAVTEKADKVGGNGFILRVNCGSYESCTDKAGNVWLSDQDMEDGRKWGAVGGLISDRSGLNVTGTDAPVIYQTERYSMDTYKFIVPNGKYTVRLHFAETYEGIYGEGERVFSVTINDMKALTDFDPYKEAGGHDKPIVKEFTVDVTGEEILIKFIPNIENPEINGIEILSK